jgi:hypothetical protein
MSLVEKAKKKAREAEKAKEQEEKSKADTRDALNRSLAKLTKEVIAGLREFNDVAVKGGTLKFTRKTNGKQIATLKLVRPKSSMIMDVELLQIEASVESGYRDYSDDCRNEPYTEASVRVSTPEPRHDNYGNPYPNYGLNSAGLRSYYGSVRNWDDEEVKKLLDEVAEWLSPLFASK